MTTRIIASAVGACVVLALAAYLLAFRPLAAQETALQAQTADLTTQRAQLQAQLAQLQMIRDDELAIRADLNRLEGLIPEGDPAQPSFVRQVQIAADQAGVTIQSLVFGEPVAVTDAAPTPDGLVLTAIPLTAVVEGGYFQAVDLFRRLEVEVPRGVVIDTVGMLEAEDGFPTLAVSVTARIFAELPVTPAVPDPAATPAPGATPSPGATPGTTPTEAAQ